MFQGKCEIDKRRKLATSRQGKKGYARNSITIGRERETKQTPVHKSMSPTSRGGAKGPLKFWLKESWMILEEVVLITWAILEWWWRSRDMGRLKHLVGAGRSFSYSKYSYLRDIYINRRNKTSLGISPQNILHMWRYVQLSYYFLFRTYELLSALLMFWRILVELTSKQANACTLSIWTTPSTS